MNEQPAAATFPVSHADILQASRRIDGQAHRTPVVESRSINQLASQEFPDRRLFFKCENLQRVGAFKFRGALNAVSQLDPQGKDRGVVTHSSGNHAQALALAAALQGIPASIVMPTTAPPVKRAAVIGYGATVVDCQPTLEAREETAERVRSQTGGTLIHPYNHPQIIAGQGTAALELTDEVPDLDVLIAPVGGGGLLAGTALVAEHRGIAVLGAEPAGADDAARSLAAGRLIPQTGPHTIADGLLTSLGDLTWPLIRDRVAGIVTVEDAEIVHWMRYFWTRTKQIIEPSSAVAVAVAMSGTVRSHPEWTRIGVILSGGNVDLDTLPWSPRGE